MTLFEEMEDKTGPGSQKWGDCKTAGILFQTNEWLPSFSEYLGNYGYDLQLSLPTVINN